jgi:hypothetical protein
MIKDGFTISSQALDMIIIVVIVVVDAVNNIWRKIMIGR